MNTAVYFDRMPSPLGQMVLASDGDALTGAWFDGQRHQPAVGPDWQRRPDLPVLRRAAVELAAVLRGRAHRVRPAAGAGRARRSSARSGTRSPTCPTARRSRTASWRRARDGRQSIRAAGAATGRNPLSIVIPCHRIVGADGALTGYAGGLARKRALLALEQGAVAAAAVPRAAGAAALAHAS